MVAPGIDLGDWWDTGSSGVHFFRTEDTGQLVLDVTITGAANRQMIASVIGKALDADTVSWAGVEAGDGALHFDDPDNSHHIATIA